MGKRKVAVRIPGCGIPKKTAKKDIESDIWKKPKKKVKVGRFS